MDEIVLSGKMKNPMILKGVFQSIWEEGLIENQATLNLENGEITVNLISDDNQGIEYQHLICEKFIDSEENEYDVCPHCHEYILKTENEKKVCAGDCE